MEKVTGLVNFGLSDDFCHPRGKTRTQVTQHKVRTGAGTPALLSSLLPTLLSTMTIYDLRSNVSA